MDQLPPPPKSGRFKRFLMKVFYPYGKRTGGWKLLKWDLKKAPGGLARAAIAPSTNLFETQSEKKVRHFSDLLRRGYKFVRAMQLSGVTWEDLERETPPPTELKKPKPPT
jgi:hypothetical protein